MDLKEQELWQGPVGLEQQPPQSLEQPQNPQKIKLIQQQLILLLHAHKCQRRERIYSNNVKYYKISLIQICIQQHCTLYYCNVMKGVLEHMVGCNFGSQCQYPHCAASRQIITHWKECRNMECLVCNPVTTYINIKQEAVEFGQNGLLQMGQQPTGQPSPSPETSTNSSAEMQMFGTPADPFLNF
jgi:hypothetical protein